MSRRYGRRHRAVRAALLPGAYGQLCHFCGLPMLPGQELHLDHTADGRGYRGIAHASCNVKDGAKRGFRRMLESKGVRRGGAIPPS